MGKSRLKECCLSCTHCERGDIDTDSADYYCNVTRRNVSGTSKCNHYKRYKF